MWKSLIEVVPLVLFVLGCIGVILGRKNMIVMMMAIELILVGVNVNLVYSSIRLDDVMGQIIGLLILTIAAAEAAIGLGILVIYFRIRGTVIVQAIHFIKG